jgi:hypothetical protein
MAPTVRRRIMAEMIGTQGTYGKTTSIRPPSRGMA